MEADSQSKNPRDNSMSKVLTEFFSKIWKVRGTPELHFITSCLSNQLPKYMAWISDPNSQGIDAMQHLWSNQCLYAFPPVCLPLSTVLSKIEQDQVQKMSVVTM